MNIGSQTWARQVYNGVGELARNRVTADDPCSVDELLLSTDYVLYGPTGQVLHRVTENGAGVAVDYIWLDDLPVAQFETSFDAQGVEQGTPKVTYLHADHLGTPRIGTNQAQQITWRWEATEAFGQSLPTGTDVVRLRFPGQVDLQVGMISYNYFRSYDALLGRYLESDPIGLGGGLNTYGYVQQNPLRWSDPLGLVKCTCVGPPGGGIRSPGSSLKVCTYTCNCDCPSGRFQISYPAGSDNSAQCIGQSDPHWSQPGRDLSFAPFSFDTDSPLDKYLNPFKPPAEFMEEIDEKCKTCE